MTKQACPNCLTMPEGVPCLGCAPQPPEESLCGEEELLASGNGPVPPSGPDLEAGREALEMWRRHCRSVGRNRVRAYDEAFRLVEMQLVEWATVFPAAADEQLPTQGLSPLSDREKFIVALALGGLSGWLAEVRRVAQDAGGGR